MIDLKQLRADADGFRGRFEYGVVDGFGFVDESCDEPWYQLSYDIERHIAEPIARMLNAVGPLLDQLTAMTAARDELVTIAKDSRWTSRDPSVRERQLTRIAELAKVGGEEGK